MFLSKLFKRNPPEAAVPCGSPSSRPVCEVNTNPPEMLPLDILDGFRRSFIYSKPFYNGCPIVYKYRRLPVSNVDRAVLREMVSMRQFSVEVILGHSETMTLMWSGKQVASLSERASMCKDWISRQDPFICEFVEFKPNEEKVALYFYRDEQSKYSDCKSVVVKLTSFMGGEKQETISFMESGEKLYVDEDDNGKYYLRDIDYHSIGNLPAKYSSQYENGEITALFYDHCDIEEKDNGDEKYIPFVKLYY